MDMSYADIPSYDVFLGTDAKAKISDENMDKLVMIIIGLSILGIVVCICYLIMDNIKHSALRKKKQCCKEKPKEVPGKPVIKEPEYELIDS